MTDFGRCLPIRKRSSLVRGAAGRFCRALCGRVARLQPKGSCSDRDHRRCGRSDSYLPYSETRSPPSRSDRRGRVFLYGVGSIDTASDHAALDHGKRATCRDGDPSAGIEESEDHLPTCRDSRRSVCRSAGGASPRHVNGGNLLRESGVVERLTNMAQNELINIVTFFLGTCVGMTMAADVFLASRDSQDHLSGVVAFGFSTAGGVLFGS